MAGKERPDSNGCARGLVAAVGRQVDEAVGAGKAVNAVRVLPALWADAAVFQDAALEVAPPDGFVQRGGERYGQGERCGQGVCARQLPQRRADDLAEADEAGDGVAGQAEVGGCADVAEDEGFARFHFDFVGLDAAEFGDGGFGVVVVADGDAAAGDDGVAVCRLS